MKQKIYWKIMLTGIISLAAIEIMALFKGVDGVSLTLIVGIIALAVGITIPNPIKIGGK